MLKNFLFVALGGALGASLRYGVVLLGTYLGTSSQIVTLFSTYSVHSVALLQEGRYGAAAAYIVGTVILCLILAWAGLIVGQKMNSHI